MGHSLPSRPNLDHLRRQAKSLLADLADGKPDAARAFQDHLPAAKGLSAAKVRLADFRLADAQSVVARRTGFASWPKLAHHVDQLRSLEGVWTFDSLEVDAQRIPAAALAHSRLLIDGDRFRMESPEATYEGIFNIDVDAEPHHLDIEFVEGPEAGRWNYAIFRVEGDRLEICLDMQGNPRPSAFRSAKGSGHAYEVLRRQSKARPSDVKGGTRSAPIPAPAPATDADAFVFTPSPTLSRLEGEWSATEIMRDGQPLPAMMLHGARRVAKGNHVTITIGGMTIIDALVRLDESTSPRSVDYLNLAGPTKGTVQLGIFDWQGSAARFCMAAPGQPRPVDFTSAKGSGRSLSLWQPVAK